MSVRACDLDQLPAAFVCITHNGFYCLQHYAEHTSDGRSHVPRKITNPLTQRSFNLLEIEVDARIKQIQNVKVQLLNKAAELLKKVQNECLASIETLDREIETYQSYTKINSFENQDLEKVSKILESELVIEINEDFKVKFIELEEEKESIDQPNRIQSIKYEDSVKCMQEKIAYCQALQLVDFKTRLLDRKNVEIQEIFFSNDKTTVFVCMSQTDCKHYAGTNYSRSYL
jgi:predicted nucleic acid binding AN1-type Zn finger protein